MAMKDMFKRKDSLSEELRMLPRETKRRILENVSRRRSEIMQEKMLKNQMKGFGSEEKQSRPSKFREGMMKRRQYMIDQGVIKPPIRYNRENFRSPMEEMSALSRKNEIKRIEDQRTKMKMGHRLGSATTLKIGEVKLKIPKSKSILHKKGRGMRDGIL